MHNPTRWFGLLLSLCLLAPRVAAAADIAVFAPEITNLSPQDADSVGGLLAQSYAAISQLSVVPPRQAAPALEQSGNNFSAAATQLGVKEYIRLSAMTSGARVVITAGRYLADGRALTQLRQTAESMEDVALAADSLARGLYGTPTAAPIATGVAVAASQPARPIPPLSPPAKKKSEIIYGIKTGVHVPLYNNATYYPAISLQFNGRLQLPHSFLEFGAGFLLPTTINDSYDDCVYSPSSGTEICDAPSNRGHIGGITTEIGASYYLTESKVAPYIGGGIIPRAILAGLDGSSDEYDVASMSVYAQIGLTFPRDRPTRFFADLRVAQAILEQHLENGREVWPTEPTLHAGIGW